MKKKFILTLILITIFFTSTCYALRIAILPFKDFSENSGSINLKITNEIAKKLEEEGFEVIPLDKLIEFNLKNHS